MVERKNLISSMQKNSAMRQVDDNTFINESDPHNRIMYEVGTKWLHVNRFQRGRWKEITRHRLTDLGDKVLFPSTTKTKE